MKLTESERQHAIAKVNLCVVNPKPSDYEQVIAHTEAVKRLVSIKGTGEEAPYYTRPEHWY